MGGNESLKTPPALQKDHVVAMNGARDETAACFEINICRCIYISVLEFRVSFITAWHTYFPW